MMYMSKHSNFPNGLSTLKGSQPEGLEQDKTLPFCTASLHLFFSSLKTVNYPLICQQLLVSQNCPDGPPTIRQ